MNQQVDVSGFAEKQFEDEVDSWTDSQWHQERSFEFDRRIQVFRMTSPVTFCLVVTGEVLGLR